MRHKKAKKILGRNTKQRKALFKGLIQSLILHEEIKTTEAKAKAIRRLVEKLVTKAKAGSLHVRRQILAFFPQKRAANKLVDEIAPRFARISGGFVRIIRLGRRRGDNAMVVKMEFVRKAKSKEKKEKIQSKNQREKTHK